MIFPTTIALIINGFDDSTRNDYRKAFFLNIHSLISLFSYNNCTLRVFYILPCDNYRRIFNVSWDFTSNLSQCRIITSNIKKIIVEKSEEDSSVVSHTALWVGSFLSSRFLYLAIFKFWNYFFCHPHMPHHLRSHL